MWIRILFYSLLVLALVLLKVTVLPAMAWPVYLVEPGLIFLIFLAELKGFRLALGFAFILGALVDLFSFNFYLSNTIMLVVTIFLLNKVFIKFFTNRSFYSNIFLTVLGVFLMKIIERLLLVASVYLYLGVVDWSVVFNVNNLIHLLSQSLTNIFIVAIFYWVIYYATNKFQLSTIEK